LLLDPDEVVLKSGVGGCLVGCSVLLRARGSDSPDPSQLLRAAADGGVS
jgi:hypothetical protein